MDQRTSIGNQTSVKASYFADPRRDAQAALYRQIDNISANAVMNELVRIEPGLLAILNDKRQIITVNRNLMVSLGVENSADLLGLRPGEALNCTYSDVMPAGCGTSQYCVSCGAAFAIVTSLKSNLVNEQNCIISSVKDGKKQDNYFKVKASPFNIDGEKFILLFMQDITKEQQRAYLERVFFHDITNIVSALSTTTGLLKIKDKSEHDSLHEKLVTISDKLIREIEIQRILLNSGITDLEINFKKVFLKSIIQNIKDIFTVHSSADYKSFSIIDAEEDFHFLSDSYFVERILTNMIINAFESSKEGETVKLWYEINVDSISFCVWNNKYIPEEHAVRIFQRNFTTKEGAGRGLGTYSMKLFAEEILKGTINFKTKTHSGTTFTLTIPTAVN